MHTFVLLSFGASLVSQLNDAATASQVDEQAPEVKTEPYIFTVIAALLGVFGTCFSDACDDPRAEGSVIEERDQLFTMINSKGMRFF